MSRCTKFRINDQISICFSKVINIKIITIKHLSELYDQNNCKYIMIYIKNYNNALIPSFSCTFG